VPAEKAAGGVVLTKTPSHILFGGHFMKQWTAYPFIAGAALLILGLLTILFPGAVVNFSLVVLGIGLLAWGVYSIVISLRKSMTFTNWTLAQGLISAIIGIIFLFSRQESMVFISWLMGFGALIWGVVQLAQGAGSIFGSQYSLIWGVASIVLGLLHIFLPMTGLNIRMFLFGLQILYVGGYIMLWASRHKGIGM
jgi:uncharacterized membrane protein HdeD (DUF308 family)